MRKIRYRFKKNPGVWGLAFPDQWRIELDPDMHEKTLMDIAIHEATHVVCPYLTEDTVNAVGIHVADLLWRLGYRKHEGD
jgi:hypothetical protein